MLLIYVELIWILSIVILIIITFRRSSVFKKTCIPNKITLRAISPIRIVIPARNEAENISKCLFSLLHQNYPAQKLKITVVNDNSTDNTADIVCDIAKSNSQIELINAMPLPNEWTGKAYACWQGAIRADEEWLCFLDADTISEPSLILSSVAFAQCHNIDLLTLQPFQQLNTFWEKVVIPLVLFMMGLLTNIRNINSSNKSDVAANGQFILLRRDVYMAIGGHSTVKHQIMEDVSLANIVKKAGFRIQLLNGNNLIKTRMYTGLGSIWGGFSKNIVDFVKNKFWALIGAIWISVLFWLSVILPILACIYADRESGTDSGVVCLYLSMIGLGLLLLLAIYLNCSVFNIPPKYAFLMPLGFSILFGIGINSIRQYITGKIVWKNRTYYYNRRKT
ncbi:MAG: hypothetical protein CVV39_04245 [Planctomycetes bacterium HGW-Planctomycetes-1]|nr:MAG: hypothetical protein CVV39_04245 [Planctomycetes bacterium HGW-Planctomycetes-1]